MGRRRGGNHLSQKKETKKTNSIQVSVGNEKNGHPVPDPNKTMRHLPKNPQRRNLERNH
jgi:hypothetical protein